MAYEVMNWKSKLFDELVSRTTFLIVLFLAVAAFVPLTPENERAYIVLAGLSIGAGTAKTIVNGVKAVKANGQTNGVSHVQSG